MACSRRHDITLEDARQRKRRVKRERAYAHFSSAPTQRRHSLRLIRQTAAPQITMQAKGQRNVCLSLHSRFPFTFLHSANLRWITGGVFNSVFVVLSRLPVQSCDAELRFCATRALRSFCMNRCFHIPIFEYPDCACYSGICLYVKMQDKSLPDLHDYFPVIYTDSCS